MRLFLDDLSDRNFINTVRVLLGLDLLYSNYREPRDRGPYGDTVSERSLLLQADR